MVLTDEKEVFEGLGVRRYHILRGTSQPILRQREMKGRLCRVSEMSRACP